MKNGVKRHPATWMIWTLSAAIAALLTRNPWYLLILSIIAVLVRWHGTGERPGGWFVRVYLSLLAFPAVLNLLFSRAGKTILLELPLRWVGGPYTLEGLVFGASAGVQIAALLTIMMVFSELVNAQDLLRRTPSPLYPVGVTASISLTFVPHARGAYDALREAQQIRGYQPKGWRDLPSVVTPLVVLSLERAIAIAESLVSRGWGQKGLSGQRRIAVIAGAMGLVIGLGLWVVSPTQWIVSTLLILGSTLVLWRGLRAANGSRRYRPDKWYFEDSVVASFSLASLGVVAFLTATLPSLLTYYPYPEVAIPNFDLPIALGFTFFSSPLWFGNHD
jgi:energy-coupling factor transporter transmembrane protein EcfT